MPHGPSPALIVATTREVRVSITETVFDNPFAQYSLRPSAVMPIPHGRRRLSRDGVAHHGTFEDGNLSVEHADIDVRAKAGALAMVERTGDAGKQE